MPLSRSPMASMSINTVLNSQSTSLQRKVDGTRVVLPDFLWHQGHHGPLPAPPTAPGPNLFLPAPPQSLNFLTLWFLWGSVIGALFYLTSFQTALCESLSAHRGGWNLLLLRMKEHDLCWIIKRRVLFRRNCLSSTLKWEWRCFVCTARFSIAATDCNLC